MSLNPQTLGSFYCESVTPSGNKPYYQRSATNTNNLVSATATTYVADALAMSSSEPYYILDNFEPIGIYSDVNVAPDSSVIPQPNINISNSKALSYSAYDADLPGSGPYGGASLPLSGSASYAINGVQYGKNASYFSIADSNSGETPPSSAPTVPKSAVAPQETQLFNMSFNTTGITGSAPITYFFRYAVDGPGQPEFDVPATLAFNGLYTYQAQPFSNLSPSTTYNFWAVARNSADEKISAPMQFTTSNGDGIAPNASISIITFSDVTAGSFRMTSTLTSRVGEEPLTFFFLVTVAGMEGPNAKIKAVSVPAVLDAETNTITGIIDGLSPSSQYLCRAGLSNVAGILSANETSLITTLA